MRKGAMGFLGRKNHSLFDTNIKMKDMEDMELVLGSSAIPESGTASVRARPTVKHHTSSYESFQGVAVPTPKVPLLPRVNGPKLNGSDSGGVLSNGSMPSVVEEDVFVPPPPSMAPPPPPATLPPPDFMGDLNSIDLAALQPPSIPAPKLTFPASSMDGEDLAFLKPPPIAPPKPPSTCSSGSASSVPMSCSPPPKVPQHPSFAPPQPPTEKQQKTYKTPPPKPTRLSSITSSDCSPQTPATSPSAQTPTLSTFNPQNTAKLYSVPQTSVVSGFEDRGTRAKRMLFLEDSGSVPVLVQMDAKVPKATTPSKPAPETVQDLKQALQRTQPASQPPPPDSSKDAYNFTKEVSTQQAVDKPPQTSAQLQNVDGAQENSKDKREQPSSESYKFSPLIERKLRNLKSSETTGPRESSAASPLALLRAAKEREKHRSTPENSILVNRRASQSSNSTRQERTQEKSPNPVSPGENGLTIKSSEKLETVTRVNGQLPAPGPEFHRSPTTPSSNNQVMQKQEECRTAQPEANELSMPVLPPPPEFDDGHEITDHPPSIPPPDPPVKRLPTPNASRPTQVPSPLKSTPPAPLHIDLKPKHHVQPVPKVSPTPPQPTLSSSQATLQSILQKKMLEMDQKIHPMKETDSTSDEWSTSVSDRDSKVPAVPKTKPQSYNYPAPMKTRTLDMRELEGKLGRKYQEASLKKEPPSNGPQSKHQYGMTFTVRPGTKQPITLVSKADS